MISMMPKLNTNGTRACSSVYVCHALFFPYSWCIHGTYLLVYLLYTMNLQYLVTTS